MSEPLLTVFTDASYCHETGAAGWAVWAKREDRPTFFKAGQFRQAMPGAFQAELGAVANACYLLTKAGYLGGDHHVLIQTDCVEVLAKLGRFAHKDCPDLELLTAPIRAAKKVVRCLEIRHVKGHSGSASGPRFAVNERCDRAAKFHMRAMRKEL